MFNLKKNYDFNSVLQLNIIQSNSFNIFLIIFWNIQTGKPHLLVKSINGIKNHINKIRILCTQFT